jgi:hypothetical protein
VEHQALPISGALYPTQWAHRCSLDTADLREANDKASGLRAQWMARFAEQRRAQNPQTLQAVSPELAAVLAERIRAKVLGADDAIRDSQACGTSHAQLWPQSGRSGSAAMVTA